MAHYDIRQEGHPEAWHTTKTATKADLDEALAVARERSSSQDRIYVVRHIHGRTATLVASAQDGQVLWPKRAAPPQPR